MADIQQFLSTAATNTCAGDVVAHRVHLEEHWEGCLYRAAGSPWAEWGGSARDSNSGLKPSVGIPVDREPTAEDACVSPAHTCPVPASAKIARTRRICLADNDPQHSCD